MKIIHTSDWHIGQTLRLWERLDEHRHFIDQLCEIVAQEKPDALLVSGDVFEVPLPTAQAQELFVDAGIRLHATCCDMKIVVTAGNHDSGSRLNINRPLWHHHNLHLIGTCARDEKGCFDPAELAIDVNGKGWIIAVPYFHPKNFPLSEPGIKLEDRQKKFFADTEKHVEKVNGNGQPVVMMAHLAVEGTDISCHDEYIGGMKTECQDDLGAGYDYLALGHIHRAQTVKEGNGMMRYSGSPFPMSFSEEFEHSVTIVEIDRRGDVPNIRIREIMPLRQVKTIKGEHGTWQEAIDILGKLDDADESYVRILIGADEHLPRSAREEAENAVQGKAARFCYVEREKSDVTASGGQDMKELGVDALKRLSPVELAQKAFASKHPDKEFPEGWEDMINQAIEEVELKKAEQ